MQSPPILATKATNASSFRVSGLGFCRRLGPSKTEVPRSQGSLLALMLLFGEDKVVSDNRGP